MARAVRRRSLARWPAAALVLALTMAATPTTAQTCGRGDFEQVVQEAASTLTSLNQKNKPAMQERLRKLRDKNSWTPDMFAKEAGPLVRDDTTDGFDKRSEELLARITAMGQDGATSEAPDCKLLGELKGAMQGLVEAQTQKWSYLFAKLDAALAK